MQSVTTLAHRYLVLANVSFDNDKLAATVFCIRI